MWCCCTGACDSAHQEEVKRKPFPGHFGQVGDGPNDPIASLNTPLSMFDY